MGVGGIQGKQSEDSWLGLKQGEAWSTLIIQKVETGVSQPDLESSVFYLLDM